TVDQLQPHSGQDGHDMLRTILPRAASDLVQHLLDDQGQRYRTHYLDRARAFPAAGDLLRSAKARGHRIALATTCARDELRHYRKLIDADDAIDAVACGNDVAHDKPDPALLEVAMVRLGVKPHQTTMVGDTPYDARAAARAGAGAIGLLCGG